jgi:hypothetical protein
MLLLFSPGCTRVQKQGEASPAASAIQDTLPQDFVTFFDRFHADTAFQIAHINFPLEGLPNSAGDTLANSSERYFWQRDKWQFHRPFTDPSHQFEQWYELLNNRVIEHWIWMKGTNLFLQRRFAKLDDEWYLIYYAGMRPRTEKLEALDSIKAGKEKEK